MVGPIINSSPELFNFYSSPCYGRNDFYTADIIDIIKPQLIEYSCVLTVQFARGTKVNIKPEVYLLIVSLYRVPLWRKLFNERKTILSIG